MLIAFKINKKTLWLFVFLATVLLTSVGTFFYLKAHPDMFFSQKQSPTKEEPKDTRTELDVILADIKTVMLLTDSERPTLATVTEVEKMRSQSFFKNAENGDKIVIYSQGKKAILWRPSTKMIIEVGTVTTENSAEAPKVDQAKKVTVLTATSDTAYVQTLMTKLKKIPGVVIVAQKASVASTITHSSIIDVTKARPLEAKLIAQTLGVPLDEKLPADETIPDSTDFVLIIGQK